MKELENKTKRNRFTRMCISEAIVALLDTQAYDTIKISEIVKKAGISRMTFYHYYHTKKDALTDYLEEMVTAYIEDASSQELKIGSFSEEKHILHMLTFFEQYAPFLLALSKAGLYQLMIDAINQYMKEQIAPTYSGSVYDLYFYGGAILNTFIKWQESNKQESIEEIAGIISRINCSLLETH